MAQNLYSSFKRFSFNNKICFLSGEEATEELTVFPAWILQKYHLQDKPIKLLDEQIVTYRSITVPCSLRTAQAIKELDVVVREAVETGFEAMKALAEIKLFQWIGLRVFGMIYFEISRAIIVQAATGERLNFSQSLIHKFENLQFMLQSLILPIEFEGVKPWSICLFKVDNPPLAFNYRDEINTLTFSLQISDFGMVACLQDNSANAKYHEELLQKIGEKLLHAAQFEEVCANFFYSSYLFNRLPEYTFLPTPDAVYIESMPFFSISGKPLFDPRQNNTYAQVFENFLKYWGVTLFDILKNPERPLSFLSDEAGNSKSVNLVEEEIAAYKNKMN